MKPDLSLVGVGLYTPAEAAVLTRVPSQKIRRWLRGHTIADKEYPALWASNLTELADMEALYLSFLDLVQLRVADAFIRAGLSAQKVRRAIEYGAKIVSSDYPFANAKFRTDGKTVILHVLDEQGDEKLIDLFRHGQYLMQKVIEPSLKGLEFEGEIAARWWPLGQARGIVIDPNRQFGQPIDAATGVPTSVLANAAEVEGSAARAAKLFLVPLSSVSRSVAFEQQLAAAA
ncbi:hypothetical protein [Bradyrhizobium elkanii]|uniref:Uncharacterized protein (DUF433 family) n=1 Tax=Bradyrhizobium elkanii TaxID=29448 RepID=A0ABV4FHW7_BRAEL|nr:hypothetical protein [Bradyrhizobium elkanii]MCP1754402.1 uncharacterized protein (DUF433 family) [Bradyrhizobium elkanii]MCP1979922.1 uncharacterized protein (DUF433 family) [Bradyrhizobium elkanii]MCS3885301.1 uncharacterized protein (DUF433 family) [Bradyrhizobium elkanii]MCS4215673.1 uncharacterized protein (DUF433 family) [Bradyrhizobium elkanii]MCW2188738.1 uncharacterized protein (DUF433 family) [Bradyrhizobium elkanii]